jgi:hypothetical protein
MKGCSGAEGQDKQMRGTTVYRDKVDEEDLAGQNKRIMQTVYMNRVDEGMQRGRISR